MTKESVERFISMWVPKTEVLLITTNIDKKRIITSKDEIKEIRDDCIIARTTRSLEMIPYDSISTMAFRDYPRSSGDDKPRDTLRRHD